jgi:E3 ubiquitin-protein ligase DOA10
MPAQIASLIQLPRSLPTEELSRPLIITILVAAFLCLVLAFLFRRRFLKILCLCGTEICLFLACKSTFGPHAIITQIMCWLTAVVACIVTIAFVNSVNWSNLRGRPGK